MNFELIFERRFSMAHRLISGLSEKCSVPHGHNEYVKVFLRSKDSHALDQNTNMVKVFAEAKTKWHQFIDQHLDHAFQLNDRDPLIDFFKEKEPHKIKRLVITKGDPTTEMMSACLMAKVQNFLDNDQTNLICNKIELEETPTNSISLSGDYAFLKHVKSGKEHWWNRADFSINDLE